MSQWAKQGRQYRWLSADRRKQKVRSLGACFQKTNRILTSDSKILVKMMTSQESAALNKPLGDVLAYSSYPEVRINHDKFGDPQDPRTISQLLGCNYHELCHIMFTPRNFKTMYLNSKYYMAWNMLEDQRIEALFTAMYEPAGKYFTQMIIKNNVEVDPSTWSKQFVMTYGRSYLPLEIREEFEARFCLPNRVKRVKSLINQYKGFTSRDFSDYNKRPMIIDCIEKFYRILEEMEPEEGGQPDPCGETEPGSSGKTQQDKEEEAKEKEDERREREEETGEDQSGFWEDDDEDEDEEGDDSEGEGEEDSEGDEGDDSDDEGGDDSDDEGGGDSADGSGEGDSDDDEGDSESGDSGDDAGDEFGDGDAGDENSSDSEHADGDSGDGDVDSDGDTDGEDGAGDEEGDEGSPGPAGGADGQFEDEELREYFEDVIDAVNDDEVVQQEINRIRDAVNDPSNIDFLDFESEFITEEAPPELINHKNAISLEYRRLYAQVEPGWNYGSDEGKLNMSRAMLDPDNFEEMYDEWDEGREDATGVEVFISLDISGSMGGMPIETGCRALWGIKRSLDEVGAKTTVVGFGMMMSGLISRDVEEDPVMVKQFNQLEPDTLPAATFHAARAVLNASEMPNKLFIVITDGGWDSENSETGKTEDLCELIEMIPGHRMYVEVDDESGWGGGYNTEEQKLFHTKVTLKQDLTPLVDITKAAVEEMIQSHIN